MTDVAPIPYEIRVQYAGALTDGETTGPEDFAERLVRATGDVRAYLERGVALPPITEPPHRADLDQRLRLIALKNFAE